MQTIGELIDFLESHAPRSTQESYDNSGLLVGDPKARISGVLIALDCIEKVIDEAIAKNCNLVVAHHPIVFKGLKSFTGKNYVERTVIKAIQNNIAIFAIHTNLDNYRFGVNYRIGQLLGLKNLRILAPKNGNLYKIVVFVPTEHAEKVRQAMSENSAGQLGNYDQCSYNSTGIGTFRAGEGSQPFVGNPRELHKELETRVEMICRKEYIHRVISAMNEAHPYEVVAYDLIHLQNVDTYQGAGMVGELDAPVDTLDFLKFVKKQFGCGIIKYTNVVHEKIQRIAFCGGSGSFLLPNAKATQADLFITADYKYHEFFDAENQLVIADIGHFESEQFTVNLIGDLLNEKNVTFAVHFTETNTNPVNYL
jgi:dinuclear metal center YbgI/SA1388 family protein